ncbi:NnrS family protein [Teredinibacter purpureus]|uniref:NnrS family protein n=1 Tax=Teredinibacter purpureus TaxID=2731756 RepID=UPI0005F7B977|nr:NnrS family protein [Teredinibacter purpureus]
MTIPVLQLAFRPLFLLAALFAVVAMAIWIVVIKGVIALSPYGGLLFWHSHELLTGFSSAVLAGFLLTAVQNWTNVPGIRGHKLLLLVLLWIVARLLMLFPIIPSLLIALVDLSFLALTAFYFSQPLIQTNNRRNLKLLVILGLLIAANALSHAGVIANDPSLVQKGVALYGWLMIIVMTVITGRILPMFTANGSGTPRVENWFALEVSTIVLTAVCALLFGLNLTAMLPKAALVAVVGLTALTHLLRCLRWRPWVTWRFPLLWSLHFSCLLIPTGLLALLISLLSPSYSQATALHWLFAGAMANMILAMMSRIALGHTGRPLKPKRLLSLAYIALAFAAIVRGLGISMWGAHYEMSLTLAASAWCLSFLIFLFVYIPILTSARADGKPG